MLRVVLISVLAFVPLTEPAAQPVESCDRTCLENWVDTYLTAMRDADVDPSLFARDLKFTENGVRLPLGNEGLWYACRLANDERVLALLGSTVQA